MIHKRRPARRGVNQHHNRFAVEIFWLKKNLD
jgi:hypothetical protein